MLFLFETAIKYRTLKVNTLFCAKRVFIRDAKGGEKNPSTKANGLSYLVDYTIQISNLLLLKDIQMVFDFGCYE
jgi:hypothetical protein